MLTPRDQAAFDRLLHLERGINRAQEAVRVAIRDRDEMWRAIEDNVPQYERKLHEFNKQP